MNYCNYEETPLMTRDQNALIVKVPIITRMEKIKGVENINVRIVSVVLQNIQGRG